METKEILKLITAFDRSTLSELKYSSGEESVELRRGGGEHDYLGGQSAAGAPPAGSRAVDPVSTAGAGSEGGEAQDVSETGIEEVLSPLVGTFYRSPSPDAPPFVEVGSVVNAGDPICILEAMKVMNELQAEFDLEIVNILIENGAMVEFGTPIFEVRKR